MSNQQHTQGPWRVGKNYEVLAPSGVTPVCKAIFYPNNPECSEANACRIVACVNACVGISTEMLEAMPSGPAALLPMYARIEQQRDELLAALEPFGATDLASPGLPAEFAMLVLRARAVIASTGA